MVFPNTPTPKLEVDHGDVKPRLPASTLLDRARLVLFGDAVALREGHVDPQVSATRLASTEYTP